MRYMACNYEKTPSSYIMVRSWFRMECIVYMVTFCTVSQCYLNLMNFSVNMQDK